MDNAWTKEKFNEARSAYLESINVKESEVYRDWHDNEFFMFDGVRIFIPQHLSSFKEFARLEKLSKIN